LQKKQPDQSIEEGMARPIRIPTNVTLSKEKKAVKKSSTAFNPDLNKL